MPLKHRHPIRKKVAEKVIGELEKKLGCTIPDAGIVESAEFEGTEIMLLDGSADILFLDDVPFLTLYGINKYKPERMFVTVDRGAVKFVTGGANVMAPGIIDADGGIRKGDIVWVRNEEGTAMALGYAVMDGAEMVAESKGKAIESVHHIGDELWKLATNL
ncbi:MAG: RNA-binding protein [Thermoplasmata archaeon]|nr:RNA-binding protein [Thermoplasmata archaeon]